jgi:hypothetical protein
MSRRLAHDPEKWNRFSEEIMHRCKSAKASFPKKHSALGAVGAEGQHFSQMRLNVTSLRVAQRYDSG